MIIFYFLHGLFFTGMGLAAYLQMRRGENFPLRKQLPWLAAFSFTYGASSWIDSFLLSGVSDELARSLTYFRIVLQPVSGLLLLVFGWGILSQLKPLPSWTIFVPGILIVPIAFVITYAVTTFITPSPIEIPVDIWSRYLLYLPGSILSGIGFLRQWSQQKKLGYLDVSKLMLGAGLAFLFEAFIVGLVVPAAPYGPASYYNYDRVLQTAFLGENQSLQPHYGLFSILDYNKILETTGLPVQFWRLISGAVVTFFVVRGLDVFDAIRKRQMQVLQDERDTAQEAFVLAQTQARQTAENWSNLLVNINRQIIELDDMDHILLYIIQNARRLLVSDCMAIALLSEKSPGLELKYYSGETGAEVFDQPKMIQNPFILKTASSANNAILQGDTIQELCSDVISFSNVTPRSMAMVPIILDSNSIGIMWVTRVADEQYAETDIIWLECMADQVVLAIKQGLMTAQLQSLSIVEERARIAREMHDGLAQILGYLNLQVQTLDVLQKQGDQENLTNELHSMREAIQNANSDVRENILSLRTTLANEMGLVASVNKYVDEFSIQNGINVDFINHVGDELDLSSIAEVQLVCILQEALTNVRKHAHAENVQIVFNRRNINGADWLSTNIHDDGRGFEISKSSRSFGLQTMRERAQSVNGTLEISSKLGNGTTVKCLLPFLNRESIHNNLFVDQPRQKTSHNRSPVTQEPVRR